MVKYVGGYLTPFCFGYSATPKLFNYHWIWICHTSRSASYCILITSIGCHSLYWSYSFKLMTVAVWPPVRSKLQICGWRRRFATTKADALHKCSRICCFTELRLVPLVDPQMHCLSQSALTKKLRECYSHLFAAVFQLLLVHVVEFTAFCSRTWRWTAASVIVLHCIYDESCWRISRKSST